MIASITGLDSDDFGAMMIADARKMPEQPVFDNAVEQPVLEQPVRDNGLRSILELETVLEPKWLRA